MINNLFSEYQFFPKYRDKELHTTGVLVGALIQNQVVTFLHLGVALRFAPDVTILIASDMFLKLFARNLAPRCLALVYGH